jgi:hypothetical protein
MSKFYGLDANGNQVPISVDANGIVQVNLAGGIAGEDVAADKIGIGMKPCYPMSFSIYVSVPQGQTVDVALPPGYRLARFVMNTNAQDGFDVSLVGALVAGGAKMTLIAAATIGHKGSGAQSSGHAPWEIGGVAEPYIRLANTYAGTNTTTLQICLSP